MNDMLLLTSMVRMYAVCHLSTSFFRAESMHARRGTPPSEAKDLAAIDAIGNE